MDKDIFQEYPFNALIKLIEPHKAKIDQFSSLLSEKKLFCISDYAGDRKQDGFNTFGYLFISWDEVQKLSVKISNLIANDKELKDLNFFEYKKLKKDKVRQRLLPEFLKILSAVNAMSVTVLSDKLFHENDGFANKLLTDNGHSKLSNHIAHRLIYSTAIQAFFCKRIMIKNNYQWYSDRDSMFGENDKKKKDSALRLLNRWFKFLQPDMKDKRYIVTFDTGQNFEGHLLAIPDIICGAVNDYELKKETPELYREHTAVICDWLTNKNSSLLKMVLKISYENENQIRLSEILI